MLYFDIQNFRVFLNDTFLDMQANTKQTKYKENLLEVSYGSKKKNIKKILPYSVIYGGNASGKTSIIKAMALLKSIILNGRIFSDNPQDILHSLELFPFLHKYNEYVKPMKLSIGFIFNRKRYDFTLQIECTLRKEYFYADRKITEEQLFINDEEIYYRDENSVKFNNKKTNIGPEEGEEHITKEELFLYSSFKTSDFNVDFQNIISWFRTHFVVVDDISNLRTIIEATLPPYLKSVDIRNQLIDIATNLSDFGPQDIFYRVSSTESGNSAEMRAHYNIKGHERKGFDTSAINTESTGTIKLVNLIMFLVDGLLNGNTIVIDELDSSLHFELVKEIVNLFIDKDINKGHGQLIFTSHNPIFIPLVKIRKDQIYFIEKNVENYSSILYSLSDFPSENVRSSEAFLKNYLDGKYGAIPSFNFEEEFKKALSFIVKVTNENGQKTSK